MENIGVVEGFYGPAWPEDKRLSYAEFLSHWGGDFYIYAPKQDSHLRKAWRENWDDAFLSKLRNYKDHFQKYGVKFGVGFSPFGLGTSLSQEDKDALIHKAIALNEIGIDLLGLFFDDMNANDKLAETQIETLNLIQNHFHQKIVFCPSYYSFDPILEKVFGKMPDKYLDKIAEGVSTEVSIAWTGPKVIPQEIGIEHLLEVKQLLKRRPFIWENLFANDGPKNCKFLKLKPFNGRSREAALETEAFTFNMMNQAELSKIVFLASKFVLKDGEGIDEAFEHALFELCSPEFNDFIKSHKNEFLEKGLDVLDPLIKENYLKELKTMKDPGAREIEDWLSGKFIVGSECLTD